MPKLDLTVSPGLLSDAARKELPGQLATAMLRAERSPDRPFTRSISWVHVHELAEDAVFDGHGPTTAPHVILECTVPGGILDAERTAQVIREATEAIAAATGLSGRDTANIWVLVHEVPDGHWGSGGRVVSVDSLRAAIKANHRTPDAG